MENQDRHEYVEITTASSLPPEYTEDEWAKKYEKHTQSQKLHLRAMGKIPDGFSKVGDVAKEQVKDKMKESAAFKPENPKNKDKN